jgi:hypothetical protein
MSTGNQPASPATTPAKTRSPVERAVVWGGILLLVVLVGIEFNWKRAHEGALEALVAKVKTADEADQTLSAADVKALVGDKAPRVEEVVDQRLASNARRVEIYTWPTLNFLGERALYVYYDAGEGDDAKVLGVMSSPDDQTVDKFNAPLTKAEEAELMKKAYIRPQKTPPAKTDATDPKAAGNANAAESATKAPADAGAPDEKTSDESAKTDKP